MKLEQAEKLQQFNKEVQTFEWMWAIVVAYLEKIKFNLLICRIFHSLAKINVCSGCLLVLDIDIVRSLFTRKPHTHCNCSINLSYHLNCTHHFFHRTKLRIRQFYCVFSVDRMQCIWYVLVFKPTWQMQCSVSSNHIESVQRRSQDDSKPM